MYGDQSGVVWQENPPSTMRFGDMLRYFMITLTLWTNTKFSS